MSNKYNPVSFNFENIKKIILFIVFFYCVFSPALYSPDTYSYLDAMPYRQMGYVIFIKTFEFIFRNYFDVAVVAFHSIFSLIAIHFFLKRITAIFKLNKVSQFLLLIILVFPFFPPLLIANNICSEGLGYGLYLFFVTLGMEIIFNGQHKYLKYYILSYLLLVSVRGQFLFTSLVFAGVYFLMNRKHILKPKHLIRIFIFCFIVLIYSLAERSYHKLKDGFFRSTPLAYVSTATAPVYLSNKTDANLIQNNDYRTILETVYDTLKQKELLMKATNTPKENYEFFHYNLPKICNQTIQQQGVDYFSEHLPKDLTPQQSLSYPFFETESASKVYTTILIKANFKKWIQLYYANISYGFFNPILLFLILAIFVYSLAKSFIVSNKNYIIIFLLASLILSNAMLIALAGHSIMRYLFYNYAIIFLLFLSTFKLFKREL